jgi:hypothetical protein
MSVYFFHGDEDYNIELEIRKLKKKLLDKNFAAMKSFTRDDYLKLINNFMLTVFDIEEYTILHEEYEFLLMSLMQYTKKPHNRIYNIGTAGGCVQPGTAYSFINIQRYNEKLVHAFLKEDLPPAPEIFTPFITKFDSFTLSYYYNKPAIEYQKGILNFYKTVDADLFARFQHDCLTLQDRATLAKDSRFRMFL